MAVPAIFEYELRNVLLTNERRGRITTEIVTEALTRLQGIPTHVDGTFADADLLQIARSHNLTVYDAAYLELSLRLDLPMATLDVRLAAAAKAEGAALVTVTG